MQEIDYDELKKYLFKYVNDGKSISDLRPICARDTSVEEWKEEVIEHLIDTYKNFRVFAMNPSSETRQSGHKEMLLKMIEFIDKS
jgi:hypothetical protein